MNDNFCEGMRVGNYQVEKLLGRGNFSQVWRGRDVRDGKLVAIKKIKKSTMMAHEKLARLLNTEVSIMNTISHKNIMHLYEFLEDHQNYYMIIEFAKDGDLEKLLKNSRNGRLAEPLAINFLKQIMNGFLQLRVYKILHRDIKLANLFLDGNRLIIGDFGFAKSGTETTTTVLGTPVTMAPELLNSNQPETLYSSKADLWSIGVVFYQMLFGELPFPGDTVDEIKRNIQMKSGDRLPFPVPVSAATSDLLRRLLQPEVSRRIDWNEFFNHAIFKQMPLNIGESAISTTENFFESPSFNVANQMFDDNVKKLNQNMNFKFADDTELMNNFQKRAQNVTPTTPNETQKLQAFATDIQEFYLLENQKTRFMALTYNKIRSCLNEGHLACCAHLLRAAMGLISKKVFMLSKLTYNNLVQGKNIYGADARVYEAFRQSYAYPETIKVFQQSTQEYSGLVQSFQNEFGMQPMPMKCIDLINNQNGKLAEIDSMLETIVKHARQFETAPEVKKTPVVESIFWVLLLSILVVAKSQEVFPYRLSNSKINGGKFSWPLFEAGFASLKVGDIRQIVQSGQVSYLNFFK